MERLKKRVWIVAGTLLAYGAVLVFAPDVARGAVRSALASAGVKTSVVVVPKEEQNESWMEKNSPKTVGEFKFVPGSDNPEVSYKMDEGTYKELRPWGIVARRFYDGTKGFDAVLIASESKDSFHDPRVCFTAQKFEITSEGQTIVPTKTRGDIPVTVAQMNGPQGKTFTAFFYRGPSGFAATTNDLKQSMFMYQCRTMESPQGVFYRFIPLNEESTPDDLFKFIAKFVDEANTVSNGFF